MVTALPTYTSTTASDFVTALGMRLNGFPINYLVPWYSGQGITLSIRLSGFIVDPKIIIGYAGNPVMTNSIYLYL